MILMLQQCICIKFTIVTRNEHLNTDKNIIFLYQKLGIYMYIMQSTYNTLPHSLDIVEKIVLELGFFHPMLYHLSLNPLATFL